MILATNDNAPNIVTNGCSPLTQDGENVTLGATIAPVCAEVHKKVTAFLSAEVEGELLKRVQGRTREALGVIEKCLERYSLEDISLSYNGGKDCLVLLILLLAALHTHHQSHPSTPLPRALQSVYIISAHPFPEVDAFVENTIIEYHLALARYAKPMKAAFQQYLDEVPSVKAILVGTRRTDPHGASLTHFDMTDHGWPKFMRVHPVIDWRLAEIWGFIRYLEIPYCVLYDQGYTSLGGTTDTHPNPALKESGKEENMEKAFRPAYELVEDEAERLGRDW